MGKKTKKRWRAVPIELCSFKPVGRKDEETEPVKDTITPPPPAPTFNEDEYTKITTPRQDVLFKKGYLGRRRIPKVPSEDSPSEHHSSDSIKSDHIVNESPDPAHMILPPPAYIDPSTVYFINGSGYEVYDPYTGSLTVVVGPPAPQYPPGGHPLLTAIPYQPMPLQPLEWFNPQPAPTQWVPPSTYSQRKRFSFDSQNCSAQSSESTGPPSSPQEAELVDDSGMASQSYHYSSYMYPAYHMNGVSQQPPVVDSVSLAETSCKRRKQLRKRRRREGIADEGSESSCEDQCFQSGASVELTIDSKTASDSGVNTHNSGGSTPVSSLPPYGSAQLVNGFENLNSPNQNLDEHDHLASHLLPCDDSPSVASDARVSSPIEASVTGATNSEVPQLDVTPSISNGESVDTVDFNGKTLINKVDNSTNATSAEVSISCATGISRSLKKAALEVEIVPTTDKTPDKSNSSLRNNVDNDNKENCDVNAHSCSKQEVINSNNKPKASSKSSVCSKSLEKNVQSNSCEIAQESNASSKIDDEILNIKLEKSVNNKQNKTSSNKISAAPSPKNQPKKSKSKSKAKTQASPPTNKLDSNKTGQVESNNEESVTNGNSLKVKKNKKNQKPIKEKVSQENQKGENTNDNKKEVVIHSDVPSQDKSQELNESEIKEETECISEVDRTSQLEVNVIDTIAELHPSESQCTTCDFKNSNGNLESRNDVEFCVDVASSKATDSSCEIQDVAGVETDATDSVIKEMNSSNCSSLPTAKDDHRLLATFIKLDQIDEASKELLANEEMLISKFSSCRDIEPVRPPRKKKNEKKLAEHVAVAVLDKMFEEAIQKVTETQGHSPGRITEAVNKWLSEQGGILPVEMEEISEEEDEDIVETNTTGSKNVEGNPFPVSSPEDDESQSNEIRKRVANKNCSAEVNNDQLDLYENSQISRIVHDPVSSVNKYYRLNAIQPDAAIVEETNSSNQLIKTDLKIHHSSPVPCGICCIIL